MAWSVMTAVAGNVFTAAQFNTNVRDNLNQTCPAVATAAGSMVYADAANSMGNDLPIGSDNSHLVSTGSAPVWRTTGNSYGNSSAFTFTNSSYLALDSVSGGTAGSAVSTTVECGDKALVWFRASMSNDTVGAIVRVSYAISGATTSGSSDTRACLYQVPTANYTMAASTHDLPFLTAGSNTFELEARCSAGTTSMAYTELTVMPL